MRKAGSGSIGSSRIAGDVCRLRRPAGALDELASYCGLGSTLIANISDALHSHSVSPPGFHIYFYAELIAGQNRAPKAGTLDAGKHHQLLITILHFSQ